MIALSGCKINLGLRILRKRPDGFHDIETMMFPIPWNDIIEMVPSNSFNYSSSGIIVNVEPSENLVVKAYNLLKSQYEIPPVHIHLHKQVPFGAGLGGGSANAATSLVLLNKLFQLNISTDKLKVLAGMLGSDCPFFIENQPAMAYNRGTDLEFYPLDLKGVYVLIIKPEFSVSTAKAYSSIRTYSPSGLLKEALSMPKNQWQKHLVNDFEIALQGNLPQLKELKQTLYEAGAFYAALSGSGSAVFGLFERIPNSINQPNLIQKLVSL